MCTLGIDTGAGIVQPFCHDLVMGQSAPSVDLQAIQKWWRVTAQYCTPRACAAIRWTWSGWRTEQRGISLYQQGAVPSPGSACWGPSGWKVAMQSPSVLYCSIQIYERKFLVAAFVGLVCQQIMKNVHLTLPMTVKRENDLIKYTILTWYEQIWWKHLQTV